ncbi:UvrD-helicase domain-containing protein [Blautia wexlerae]|uniref:UvrD-helicase domain-containing protein n=1 Tax=Blautia wexlerae TaxID=418240 RepID=UPI00189D26ED|nr:ATP-dependent helicase [Blautia wexlerae]
MKKNIEQEKAIAQLEGPVILISCPGSGKTTTLLRRINHMLEVGIPPEKILMITFTKAAAQEMSVKFKKKFGEPNGITFSTIHALCLKILMTYGGLSAENIIKTSDQWKFLLETARKCQSVCDPAKAAGNFQMLYSAAMNNRMSPSEVNPKDIKGISRKDFLFMSDEYRRMKERTGYIDFDDMLVKAYELMTGNPQVLRQLRERWDYIQVDEYRLSRGIAASGDFKRIADRPNRYMRLILHEAGGEQEADLLEAASRKYTDWRRDNARKIIRKYFYDIREMGKKSPRQFLDYLLKDVGYEKYLREYAESLQQDFDEMKHMLSIYQRDSQKFHTMKEWLLYIKKRSMNLNNNNDQGVCLSTMHRSKGLEWKNVYIIDCNEGYIPPGSPDTPISQEEVEEERRLFYVAVTRAKERLFITYVGNKKGKPVSRFVRELQLKESGRAKTVKKNDMVRHKTYGVCMVLSVNGNKCTIRSLSDDRDAEVLVSSLDIR